MPRRERRGEAHPLRFGAARRGRLPETPAVTTLALILTTVATEAEAAALAEALVAERLAGCVQWQPVTSRYRWQGRIEQGTELRLHIKTAPDRAAAAIARLRALHPYALPEIVTVETQGSVDYVAWITAETRSQQ